MSLLAPPLAAGLAKRLFLTPRRTRHRPGSDLARGGRSISLSFDGRALSGWQWGEGASTALLVHGWAGHGLQLSPIGRALADCGWRAVAVDLPGHGRSPGRRTNLIELAAAVASAARQLGAPDAVVSHSFGAAATLVAMERHELDSGRLIAVAPATRLRSLTDRFSELTGFTPGVVEEMRRRMAEKLGFRWDEIEGSTVAPRIRTEALVLHDRDDREIPVDDGIALAAELPRAELVLTEGFGHRTILRDPAVIRRITDFATRPNTIEHPILERRTS